MNRFLPVLLAAGCVPVWGQAVPAPGEMGNPTPTPSSSLAASSSTAPVVKPGRGSAETQALIERLTRSNQELLDLLKKQQAVLEDIQYDRRLQNRQITLIEERLEDTLQNNATLQAKMGKLQAQLADASERSASGGSPAPAAPASDKTAPAPSTASTTPPPPPSTYLPEPETGGAPGTMWWHRVTTLSGDDSKSSDMFHIEGKQWRVLWHNQDRPGDTYKNTSALFISAFPKSDSIPKKVCSQLGTGGDTTELTGTGSFYLKVEASGGHWELAVEDFH